MNNSKFEKRSSSSFQKEEVGMILDSSFLVIEQIGEKLVPLDLSKLII